MHTPTQIRRTPSRALTTRRQACLSALLTTALACITGACGTPKGGGDEQGDSDEQGETGAIPGYSLGYAVDCLPDSPKEPLVCVPQADWNCPLRGNYFREAVCAYVLGGTPSEYDGKPEMVKVDPDGAGPEEPTANIYCDNLPDGVITDLMDGLPCNDCNVCSLQLQGYFDVGFPQGYGWDEFPWCPDSYDAIAKEFCHNEGNMDTPTTGEVDGGDVSGSGIWECIGSWTISGTMTDTSPPETSMKISMSPLNRPDCVNATDEAEAAATCLALCEFKNQHYIKEAEDSQWKVWEPFVCDDLNNFTPIEAADLSQCAGEGTMALTDPTPFTATSTLKIGDATATSDQLGGLLEFTIEACSTAQPSCDLSITEIRADARTVHGIYTDPPSGPVPFSIADLEVRMLQPVLGQWERSTGRVTFPGKDLFATISTGIVSLDGEPMSQGLDHVLFEVEGAQGRWDGQQLTLDLPWRKNGLELSLRISAQSRPARPQGARSAR